VNELYDEPVMNGLLGRRWHNRRERIDDAVDVVEVKGTVVKLNLSRMIKTVSFGSPLA
jgi:hypothetical protein